MSTNTTFALIKQKEQTYQSLPSNKIEKIPIVMR
jgi:hypothetical protein